MSSERVPDPLLHPLLDSAGEVLRALDPHDVPVVLRAITGFDRRGMARGPARQQLRQAVDLDDKFRVAAVEHFLARPEVVTLSEQWDTAATTELIAAADERGDLPLVASMLYAERSDGWQFALGAVCGAYARGRRSDDESADQAVLEVRIDELQEACRRVEGQRSAAAVVVDRLETELHEERRARRDREAEVEGRVAKAQRHSQDRERAADVARRQADSAGSRLDGAADRVRAVRSELATARAELTTAREAQRVAAASGLRPEDLQTLADAASLAQRLADGLGGVVAHARARGAMGKHRPGVRTNGGADEAPAIDTPTKPEIEIDGAGPADERPDLGPAARRVALAVPPGLMADAPEAVKAMLRHDGVVAVLDGYNVSMTEWPDRTVADQRDALVSLVAEVALRTRASMTIVFDGADVGHVPVPRRPGVRVVFSSPGEKADPVIVREVASLALTTPVLVVSSDRWVQSRVRQEGAYALESRAFLGAFRH